MDVFNLLGLPPKPLDLVLLRDFLQVNDKLSQHSLELQVKKLKTIFLSITFVFLVNM